MTNEKTYSLPELTGSEKQIAWALKIRTQKIQEFEDRIAKKFDVTIDYFLDDNVQGPAVQAVLSKDSAAYWIDNRHTSFKLLAKKQLQIMRSNQFPFGE